MRHGESQLQQTCFSWFRLQYPQFALNYVAVPNGGRRGKVEAAIMKGEGTVAGVADSVLFVPSSQYHGLCIEFKRLIVSFDSRGKEHIAKTYQSKEQKAWQQAVEDAGYKYVVVRAFDEFKDAVEEYFSGR